MADIKAKQATSVLMLIFTTQNQLEITGRYFFWSSMYSLIDQEKFSNFE